MLRGANLPTIAICPVRQHGNPFSRDVSGSRNAKAPESVRLLPGSLHRQKESVLVACGYSSDGLFTADLLHNLSDGIERMGLPKSNYKYTAACTGVIRIAFTHQPVATNMFAKSHACMSSPAERYAKSLP